MLIAWVLVEAELVVVWAYHECAIAFFLVFVGVAQRPLCSWNVVVPFSVGVVPVVRWAWVLPFARWLAKRQTK